ncbi:MAG: hypothetical protein PHU80_02490 [Kiritimatiellae bacterium]|nr:hypothetical protein [Kiritimatiellia bacterium]
MKLRDIIDACGLEPVLVPDAEAEVSSAYTSDLLSDVVAHCTEKSVLITVQNHKNTVAVCTLVGAPAILIAHRREIPADMQEAAAREGVALLHTSDSQFAASCKVGSVLGIDPR